MIDGYVRLPKEHATHPSARSLAAKAEVDNAYTLRVDAVVQLAVCELALSEIEAHDAAVAQLLGLGDMVGRLWEPHLEHGAEVERVADDHDGVLRAAQHHAAKSRMRLRPTAVTALLPVLKRALVQCLKSGTLKRSPFTEDK
eukprot:CAMPEP_0206057954 /NCGR_PEP_ID=MMETSP1466-20131121/45532_1 /ASSEMBLY_ACC=CAM_ASM_001126 /TAXON_ID=44452 /ORGANISM="Pavlova gyrans, Strain CCMP608" /LENGTH=141 /DNA_ID=CAMNT_0053433245 /DNA_START=110 /DNA_END=533 /DNA_ORIENTATION=+